MHEVVLEFVCAATVLNRKLEAQTQALGHRIKDTEIPNIDVRVVLEEGEDDFLAAVIEIAKGMKVAIRQQCYPLLRLEIR